MMGRIAATFDRFTRTAAGVRKGDRRRAHLLAWLQISLLALTAAVLVPVLMNNPPGSSRQVLYVALVVGIMLLLALAYGVNRAGHYRLSASLTVACAVIGPWASALVDPTVLRGDFVPLTYVTLSILLAGLLLHPLATAAVAAAQIAGLLVVFLAAPGARSINWPSLLSFVFFASVLSVLSSVVGRQDMEQIDEQTARLSSRAAWLREQSIRDHLTGLFNRRYMEETLDREIERAARDGLPLGLVMIDIDRFKRLNDALGHEAGDAVLRDLGRILGLQVRQSDIACRYGGEEFVLILPGASPEITRERAERVRRAVKRVPRWRHEALAAVTVSLGVAGYPRHGLDAAAVLAAADMALYRAKREGRDRVVVADLP